MTRIQSALVALGIVGLLAGCGDSGGGPNDGVAVEFIALTTGKDGGVPTETVQFQATAYDSSGTPIPGLTAHWSSEDPQFATISQNGLLTAISEGTARLSVRFETDTLEFFFTVLPSVSSISLTGIIAPLPPGGSFRLPLVKMLSGAGDSLRSDSRELSWTSSDPGVAQVDETGLITSIGPGTTTIELEAVIEGVTGSVTLDVSYLNFRMVQDGGSACGLTVGGRIYCWQATNGFPWPLDTPLLFDSLSVGMEHACALTSTGAAYCWGANIDGALGDGTQTNRSTPTLVSGGHVFTAITVGINYTCGLESSGAAFCWGYNSWGNLGAGDQALSLTPRAAAPGLNFSSLSLSPVVQTGGPHTCGMELSGTAYCWGANEWGQLGNGSRVQILPTPDSVVPPSPLVTVESGGQHGCGLDGSGVALCWGDDQGGALGDRQLGFPPIDSVPAAVPAAPAFTQLKSALYRNCGLTSAGDVYCWGDVFGINPVQIDIPAPLATLVNSANRFCGATAGQVFYCWTLPSLPATKEPGQQ